MEIWHVGVCVCESRRVGGWKNVAASKPEAISIAVCNKIIAELVYMTVIEEKIMWRRVNQT